MAFDPETYERLMLKQLDEQATAEELQALSAWLAASPEHRRQYEQLKSVWEVTAESPVIPSPDKAKAWAKVSAKARLRQAPDRPAAASPHTRTRRLSRVWLALPMLIAGISILWLFLSRTPSMIEVAVLSGQVRTVTLPDNSVIRMHGGSTLKYSESFSEEDRTVSLEGEAFFDVTQTGLPFQVLSNETEVQVLGTQFSIRSQEASTEVVVTEGRVRVLARQPGSQSVELGPGEGVSVANSQITPLEPTTLGDTEAWIANSVTFDATSFPEAIEQLSRIWRTPISITTPSLESQTVTGSIRLDDIQKALETICLTSGSACSVRVDEGAYLIF